MKKLIVLFLFLSVVTFGQVFDWEWQHPYPTANDVNDALYLSDGTLMIFGDAGTVGKSTDNGVTWSIMNVDTSTWGIYEADFVDDNTGWIVGENAMIMKTTDGGATWNYQTPPAGVDNTLWYVDFFDANTGYAVGSSGTIIKTTDGGATWTQQPFGSTTLYKVHCVDANTAYIGAGSSTYGRLIKTTDGGTNWVDITGNTGLTTGTVRGIFFLDANNGWISTGNYEILNTTDGGTTWTMQQDFATSDDFYEIKFFDANNGIAAGADGQVAVTTDGGTTWTLQTTSSSENLFSLALQSSYALTENAMGNIFVGGDYGDMSLSTDAGATWNQTITSLTFEDFRDVYFPDSNTGYVVGGATSTPPGGQVLKTTDAGLTWQLLGTQIDYRLYSVFFLDASNGFIGKRGPDGMYQTTDGGATWTTINTGIGASTNIIYDIYFMDSNNGFFCGSASNFGITTDGGATWTSSDPGFTTSSCYEMHIFDASTYFVVGSSGKYAKTTDGGTSWAFTDIGSTSLYGVSFPSATTGYICGSSGTVLKSTDAGDTWNDVSPNSTATLYSVHFTDDNIGWVSSSFGTIYYTTDGGANWMEAKPAYGTTLYKITARGGHLWFVGVDGAIIRGYDDPDIPVELTSFSANVSNSTVTLSWTTATETNNYGFEIERKSADESWTKIGFVPGTGTTTEQQSYSFVDDGLLTQSYTYRLKQLDLDGRYEYSTEIEVSLNPAEYALEQNYPNPFNPATTIKFSIPQASKVQLVIYNQLGEKVAELVNKELDAGYHIYNFNASELASGVYFYSINAGDFQATKKMLLLK